MSFGVVEALDHEDLPTLINRADAALFQAKRDGRDRVVIHDAFGNVVPAGLDRTAPPADHLRLLRGEEMNQAGLHTETPVDDGHDAGLHAQRTGHGTDRLTRA